MTISCKVLLCSAAVGLVLAALPAHAQEPVLRIAKQGSMEAGGNTIYCATNDGGDPDSKRFPSGHVVVDNVYATYQYPADQRYPYPVLFNSGGGLGSAAAWTGVTRAQMPVIGLLGASG